MMKLVLALLLFAQPAYAAVDLDGTDDQVGCLSPATLDNIFTGGGTICVRFRMDTTNGFMVLVTKINSSTFAGWTVGVGDDGSPSGTYDDIFFYQSSNSGASAWEGYGTGVAMTTTDPTGAVNGTAVTFTNTAYSGTVDSDAAETFIIGSQGGSYWNGRIREVVAWNSSLTAAQMADITASRAKRFQLNTATADIVGYWPLDDGVGGVAANGTTANDLSGNDNDCTPNDGANNTGMTWFWDQYATYP